jgi:hypothetical protein
MAKKSAKQFTKAVLRVGETMQSPDGLVPITAERLSRFAEQHKKLTAAGYAVPSRWEHADKPDGMLPLAAEEMAEASKPESKKLDGRHAVGRMVDFTYAPGAEQAEMTLEVSDPRALQQVEANLVKVSPILAGWWKDGHGNEYADFISHADLVERPVDYTQGDFKPVPHTIACSLEKFIDAKTVKLAFPDDSEDKPDDSETPPESPPAEPAKNPDAPPKATDKSKTTAVLDGLKTKGIVLPSDFDFSGDAAIDILLAAINSSVAADVKQEESEQEDDKDDDPPVVASPGYAQMSTEQKGNVAFALLERKHREQLGRDLNALLESGRCTPAEANDRKAALGTVKLALDDAGNEVPGDIEKFIASRQPVPKGTFWTDEQRTKLRLSADVAEPPYRGQGDETETETAAAVDAQLKATGHLPASK